MYRTKAWSGQEKKGREVTRTCSDNDDPVPPATLTQVKADPIDGIEARKVGVEGGGGGAAGGCAFGHCVAVSGVSMWKHKTDV